jgi:hypothetical protein
MTPVTWRDLASTIGVIPAKAGTQMRLRKL